MAHHQPEELSRLQEYLEKEAGFDPLITHGIVEAISSAEREEAEEIANVYLEGNDKALDLVREYFAVLDASRPGSKAEGTDAAEAAAREASIAAATKAASLDKANRELESMEARGGSACGWRGGAEST